MHGPTPGDICDGPQSFLTLPPEERCLATHWSDKEEGLLEEEFWNPQNDWPLDFLCPMELCWSLCCCCEQGYCGMEHWAVGLGWDLK